MDLFSISAFSTFSSSSSPRPPWPTRSSLFRAHDVNVSSHGTPPLEDSLLLRSSGFVSALCGDYWKFMKKFAVTNLLGPHALERSRVFIVDKDGKPQKRRTMNVVFKEVFQNLE
ncbi:unnamed protein product [Cochlearia groenlandica]